MSVLVVTEELMNLSTGTLTTSGTGTLTVTPAFTATNGISSLTGTSTLTTGQTAIFTATAPTYNDFWNFNEEWDLLWKSFFDKDSSFRPIREKAVSHPCDIQETDNGLKIEIAAVGLDKSDIDIIVDSETLRIAYRKSEEEKKKEKEEYRYLHRSIKKASFDIAWKISSKYDLQNLTAKLDKGLLSLEIPFAKENKPKKIKIN
jgi:HSP20 family protein